MFYRVMYAEKKIFVSVLLLFAKESQDDI